MVTPEPCGLTTEMPNHPNSDEAEENNIKNSFMKMIVALKDKMKFSLKEIKEKAKMDEINKSHKKSTNPRKYNQTGEGTNLRLEN